MPGWARDFEFRASNFTLSQHKTNDRIAFRFHKFLLGRDTSYQLFLTPAQNVSIEYCTLVNFTQKGGKAFGKACISKPTIDVEGIQEVFAIRFHSPFQLLASGPDSIL
jgi:hypothetical protein